MLLYVSDRPHGNAVCKHLFSRGILLFRASFETARFLCEKKDTGGVVIDCIPNLSAGEALCRDLRLRYPTMPIAALVSPDCVPNLACDLLIRAEDAPDTIAARVEDFYVSLCGWSAKSLSTFALTLNFDTREVHYLGYPLSLTPTELCLLYCIFYRSPQATTADDLLSLCYFGRSRSISNVSVQLHRINQKASRIDPRPLIIHTRDGYRLRDGIV